MTTTTTSGTNLYNWVKEMAGTGGSTGAVEAAASEPFSFPLSEAGVSETDFLPKSLNFEAFVGGNELGASSSAELSLGSGAMVEGRVPDTVASGIYVKECGVFC